MCVPKRSRARPPAATRGDGSDLRTRIRPGIGDGGRFHGCTGLPDDRHRDHRLPGDGPIPADPRVHRPAQPISMTAFPTSAGWSTWPTIPSATSVRAIRPFRHSDGSARASSPPLPTPWMRIPGLGLTRYRRDGLAWAGSRAVVRAAVPVHTRRESRRPPARKADTRGDQGGAPRREHGASRPGRAWSGAFPSSAGCRQRPAHPSRPRPVR